MNEQSLLDILHLLGITNYKPSGPFYYMVECPVAFKAHRYGRDAKPSCSIGHSDRPTYFSCFSCGYKASVWDVAYLYFREGLITKDAYWSLRDICEAAKADEFSPEALQKKMEELEKKVQGKFLDESVLEIFRKAAPKWLLDSEKGWSVSLDTCKKFNIRHNSDNRMVVMPVYDKKGLRGLTQRCTDGKGPKYLSNEGFQNHHFLYGANLFADVCSPLPSADGVILVEGQFDVMSLHERGFTNALGMFSVNITQAQIDLVISYDRPVYVFLDNDEAGHTGTKRTACLLADHLPVYVVKYPEGYPPKADPKKLTYEQILDLLGKAEYFIG